MALAATWGHFHLPTAGSLSTATASAFISYTPGDEAGGTLMPVALPGYGASAHAAEHATWSANRAMLWLPGEEGQRGGSGFSLFSPPFNARTSLYMGNGPFDHAKIQSSGWTAFSRKPERPATMRLYGNLMFIVD